MRIDLHVHDKERSACSIATEKEHIEAAIRYGLDAIIFTDHNRLTPVEHLKELNEKYKPFKIFGGIEISIINSCEHVLVLGLHDAILENKKWSYEELYKYVKDNNGYIALCHPYRYRNTVEIDIENYIPDAIEIHSTNIGIDDTERIVELSQRLKTNLITNSDAHDFKHVGIYCNELFKDVSSETDLIDIMKNGLYKQYRDEKRVKKFDDEVEKREKIIKQIIKEGKDREYYHNLTGRWAGEFDRVAMGKTYKI